MLEVNAEDVFLAAVIAYQLTWMPMTPTSTKVAAASRHAIRVGTLVASLSGFWNTLRTVGPSARVFHAVKRRRRFANRRQQVAARMHCLRNHPSMFRMSGLSACCLVLRSRAWNANQAYAHAGRANTGRERPPALRSGCEFTTYLSVCIVGSVTRVGAPFIRFNTAF